MEIFVKVYSGPYQVSEVATLAGIPMTLSSLAIVCFPKGISLGRLVGS